MNAPSRGMIVFVLDQADYTPGDTPLTQWSLGAVYRVRDVNSRSFYVYTSTYFGRPSRLDRYLNVEWKDWLNRRCAEGVVWVDGVRYRPPASVLASGGQDMSDKQVTIDVKARDQRFLRAAHEVLARYRIEARGEADGMLLFELEGGSEPYQVRVARDWSSGPSCSCPDAEHRKDVTGGYCKHVIAVLLKHEELKYQLLDVML
mgnify:CR=1 FL=1